MIEKIGSRRTVLGAGVVAGAAMLAPLAFRGGGGGAGADGITVVPGRLAAFADDPAELDRWAGMVGRPVRLAGSVGVIDAVEPVAIRGLPAGVRERPFAVRFAVDPAGAPAGDATIDVGTTIEGLSRLFVQRGADRGGKAMLSALFA